MHSENLKDTYRKTKEWAQLMVNDLSVSPFVLLKLSMIWHGVVLTERALDRLQAPDYCFGKWEPFGLTNGSHVKKVLPGAILLRDATFVHINYGEPFTDPFTADFDPETGCFLLMEKDHVIDEIDFVPRPSFYGKVTSKGTPMETVALARAQKLILSAFQKCLFWKNGEQCHYCAFFSQTKTAEVDEEDIFETVQEALKEPGRYSQIYLSGGSDFRGDYPFEEEIQRYIRIFRSISTLFQGRFHSQLMAPAYKKEDVKKIYEETGITSYCPNIEIMDKTLFQRLCPGKEKWIGYDTWIRRTLDAVDVFGEGNVYTQIVAGAELARPYGFQSIDDALRSNFKGCEFFAKNGVICLSTIWRPHRYAKLGFQPMPPLDYYIRLTKGFHEIRKSYGLVAVDDNYKLCGNHPDSDLERLDFSCKTDCRQKTCRKL